MTDIRTMNLSDNSDAGMVSLNPSTSFVSQNSEEKNVSENKVTMDSTPIAELMGQPEPIEAPQNMPMQMQFKTIRTFTEQSQLQARNYLKLTGLKVAYLINFPPFPERGVVIMLIQT